MGGAAPPHGLLHITPRRGAGKETSDAAFVGKGGQGRVFLSTHRGKETATKVVPAASRAASEAEIRAVRAPLACKRNACRPHRALRDGHTPCGAPRAGSKAQK